MFLSLENDSDIYIRMKYVDLTSVLAVGSGRSTATDTDEIYYMM